MLAHPFRTRFAGLWGYRYHSAGPGLWVQKSFSPYFEFIIHSYFNKKDTPNGVSFLLNRLGSITFKIPRSFLKSLSLN